MEEKIATRIVVAVVVIVAGLTTGCVGEMYFKTKTCATVLSSPSIPDTVKAQIAQEACLFRGPR